MSPQKHDHGAATAGLICGWGFPTCDAVSWRYGANFGLWHDSWGASRSPHPEKVRRLSPAPVALQWSQYNDAFPV